ncbi:KDEL motif-containing protein 2 [Morella rubra]|uniref:KDEL motif-containing protein 2 n=1 Tax=Morella rubra TaxID=262757 RepID=A0A6A1UMC3_9ROSI|nr:KDEL motif-containing protein 2 [Morella rubra]
MATQPQQLWDCCPPKTQLAPYPSPPYRYCLGRLLSHCYLPLQVCLLEYFFGDSDFFLCNLIEQVDDFAFQTKTVAGHNLDPTPWHPFPPKNFGEQTRQALAYKIIYCSYLSLSLWNQRQQYLRTTRSHRSEPNKCPDFFRWIHHDLEPWARNRISSAHLAGARKFAAFRVVIVGGKLYADFYYTCVQSRAMFTIWGLLQLQEDDTTEHRSCRFYIARMRITFRFPIGHSGWPETNLRPWDEEFRDIKRGSQRISWSRKVPRAYWKGNPDVNSPVRLELLKCNHSRMWGAQIMRQDWAEEARIGYGKSKLSNQCDYQYKIYAEGYAWSVSLKYILSCGSLALIITPDYEDFFSRGLIPLKNYWPVSSNNICPSIKYAVDWGNGHPSEAKAIGKEGQKLMETLSTDKVYDYMFHLITEYSKLQDFKPVPPSSAQRLCSDSLLCIADYEQRQYLQQSTTFPSQAPPCTLQPADRNVIKSWKQQKKKIIKDVEDMEKVTL